MGEPDVVVGSEFADAVVPLIGAAKRTIDIAVFDWRVYPNTPLHPVARFTRALGEAAQRGVRVRVITNNDAVRQELEPLGLKTQKLAEKNLLHAKVMLLDGLTAVVGSHNYTQRAMTSNLEVSVVVRFAAQPNRLTTFFERLWP